MRSELPLTKDQIPRIIEKGYNKPVKWNGIVLQPTEKVCHIASKKSLQKLGLAGLQIKISHGTEAKVYISNSLHKVMHNGSNADDFYFSEITDYITLVSEHLGIPYWDARPIGRFEFAVNLIEDNPSSLINDLDTLKHKPFDFMKGKNGKIYGKQSQIQAIKTKIYNVHLKDKLSGMLVPSCENNILRIENVSSISYLKKKGLPILKMADLTNKKIINQLGGLLVKSLEQISFLGRLPTSAKYTEKEAYYFFKNATQDDINDFKKYHPSTFKNHKRMYRKLNMAKSARVNNLPNRVANKWKLLTSK